MSTSVSLKRLWRQSAHRAAPCSLRRSTGHVVFPAVHGRCTELPGDPRRGSDPRLRLHHARSSCYATSAQRWVANAGQADGKTVTSGPGSRPINAATRTPFECARPNHPKRPRSLVSGSPPINYASASGCLRERQLWHRPHRCESTVPTLLAEHLASPRTLRPPPGTAPRRPARCSPRAQNRPLKAPKRT